MITKCQRRSLRRLIQIVGTLYSHRRNTQCFGPDFVTNLMHDTKLILIDGLPGSGKSTAAQRLWLHLLRHDFSARWFPELHCSHPIYPYEHWDDKFSALLYKPPSFLDVVVERWAEVAQYATNNREITILDGTLFQSTVGWLHLLNVDYSSIFRHLKRVCEAISCTAPSLIYFRPADPAKSLMRVSKRRGEWFHDLLVSHISKTPFGQTHKVVDFAGVVSFVVELRDVIDWLLGQLDIHNLTVATDEEQWSRYYAEIVTFLRAPTYVESCCQTEWSDLIGAYQDHSSTDVMRIALDSSGLYIDNDLQTQLRLFQKEREIFCVQGFSIELKFTRDDGTHRMEYISQCSDHSRTLVKMP